VAQHDVKQVDGAVRVHVFLRARKGLVVHVGHSPCTERMEGGIRTRRVASHDVVSDVAVEDDVIDANNCDGDAIPAPAEEGDGGGDAPLR
jgi:hypothetical protein